MELWYYYYINSLRSYAMTNATAAQYGLTLDQWYEELAIRRGYLH